MNPDRIISLMLGQEDVYCNNRIQCPFKADVNKGYDGCVFRKSEINRAKHCCRNEMYFDSGIHQQQIKKISKYLVVFI